MIDKKKEIAESSAWLERQEGFMEKEEFIFKTVAGFRECSTPCLSKKYSVDGMCSCIRENYPTVDHYLASMKLREQLELPVILGAFCSLVKLKTSQDNDREDNNDGNYK